MMSIQRFIESRLRLKVNTNKSAVDYPWKRTFLGISFLNDENKRVRIAPKSLERFKMVIRKLTRKSWSIAMEERLKKLRPYLIGWMNYFRVTQAPSVLEELDGWIRRRLRACLLKQWKNPITIKRNLIKLGLSKDSAAKFAYSRKGIWRRSLARQSHFALGIKFWDEHGLVSLKKRYLEVVKV